MPTAAQVNTLRRSLATSAKLARRELDGFWATLNHSDPTSVRTAVEEFFPILVREYGNVAAVVAGDWYEDVYSELADFAPDAVNVSQVNARARWAIGPSFRGDPAGSQGLLSLLADELIRQYGRDTVKSSATRHGRSYARVPAGAETCAFCLMLASRGFVYGSRAKAGAGLDRFHGDCDCEIVAHDGIIPDGYDPDALYEIYRNAADPGDTERDVTRKLREQLGQRR